MVENESSSQDWSRSFNINQRISAGLDEDLERIIYKVFDEFEKHDGPRFEIFTEVWHQTGLGLIFSGRETFREMSEFSEDLFFRVKKYALSILRGKPNHALVRYAALYMLYSLYFKQPCRPRIKIRLVKEELKNLLETTVMARQESHWDVLYAWSKLFTSHAFHYVACQSEMGLEVALQMEARDVAERNNVGAKEEYFKSKEFTSLMKTMGKAHSKYVSMKNSLASSNVKANTGLFLTDQNFPQTVSQVWQQEIQEEEEEVASKDGSSEIGDRRKGIKDKFFSGGGEDTSGGQKKGRR